MQVREAMCGTCPCRGRSVDGSQCVSGSVPGHGGQQTWACGDRCASPPRHHCSSVAAAQMPVVRDLYSRTVGVTPQILSTSIISSMATYINEQIAGARTCHGDPRGKGIRSVTGAQTLPGCVPILRIAVLISADPCRPLRSGALRELHQEATVPIASLGRHGCQSLKIQHLCLGTTRKMSSPRVDEEGDSPGAPLVAQARGRAGGSSCCTPPSRLRRVK